MKTFKYFNLLFIAVAFAGVGPQPLYAQNLKGKPLADSLMNELPTTKSDTSRINIIIKAASALSITDPPMAMNYADSAIHLSQLHEWKKGIGLAYIVKGRIYRTTSDYALGIENAGKAFAILDSVHWQPGMGDALTEAAANYQRLGNYTKAIEYNFKALAIYEAAGAGGKIENVYNSIGSNYYQLYDYTKAIENYTKSLELFKKTGDKFGIGSVLDNMASVYQEQGEFKKANDYSLQAIKLFEEINNEPAMGRIYVNRGNFLQDQQLFDSALIFYKKAIAIAGKLGIKSTLAFGNGGIGDIYLNLAKNGTEQYTIPDSLKAGRDRLLEKAYNYFSRALELSEKAGELALMMRFTGSLSATEALRGNYKTALNFYTQSTHYKDSIFNDVNKTKIAALENERLAEEQKKKDVETKRVKNIQYFTIAILGIVVLAVLIIAIIQYRNGRHKQKANALLLHQKEKLESTLSELKSAQAQLIQSEKMASLGELTAGIAHEIQNPLNFVNNFSEINTELIAEMKNELLADHKAEAVSIAENIEENEQKITLHGKRADAIVKSMLQHSRISTGHNEPTDINALADQYLRLSYQGIRAADKSFNATLKTDFDNSIGKINIIPQDIGRVILNILNNAFYAVGEKKKAAGQAYEPTVLIATKKVDSKIEIHVQDNGTGIPQRVTDKIFQPFFTTKPSGEGTGLGLSLSYDSIKAHGGQLKVETTEGEGSLFIIQLPVK